MADNIPSKVEKFFSGYRVRTYSKGQILILNGDKSHCIYHLLEGKVKQYDVTYRGEEVILNVFKPPAFFPMAVAIANLDNRYIYEADTNITVRQAPLPEVVQFVQENPDVLLDLLRRVYIGVEGLLGRMSYLMAGSASSRLLYELIIEARRFGTKLGDDSYTILITEKDIGARAGLSRETVSREMSKLKKAGLVEIRTKDILVKNMLALEKKLGQEI